MAVGGQKRGVVASASYEARQLGVRTAMPTAWAQKICPQLVVLPGDFEKYERFSRFLFSYPYDFTPTVEAASIDEGYGDLSGHRRKSPGEIVRIIRRAVHQSLKITLSEGLGGNKLVSQIASKIRKPDALVEVARGDEAAFLAPLESRWLPGVGPQLAQVLRQAGLARIGQIARLAPGELTLLAGRQGRLLWEFAQGIDERPVLTEAPAAKSYSAQETFAEDQTDEDFILAKLRSLSDRLMAEVRGEKKALRTVEVRIRYNDFDDCRRSESLLEPTDLESDVYPVLKKLLHKAWQRRVSLRLVAVKFSGLYPALIQQTLPLWDAGPDPGQRRRLATATDQIRARYGNDALMRGHDLFLKVRETPTRRSPAPPSARPTPAPRPARNSRPTWVPLNFKSGYSFSDSLLKPRDIVRLAVEQGFQAAAITDPNLHGAVEFYLAAREAGIKPVIGAELLSGGRRYLAYVKNQTGYTRLCALLSMDEIPPETLATHGRHLILRPADSQPEIRYARAEEKPMFDILQSIRTLGLLEVRDVRKRRGPFHFPEVHPGDPDSLDIADQCEFEFELGQLKFPRYQPSDGATAHDFLRRLAREGAVRRYGDPLPAEIDTQLDEELEIIAEVGYEEYFLAVWELLQDCRTAGIDWITRGSAADSLVCYSLGISDVCPIRFELYFRRFLNRDRMALNKLPDIDIDFPHDRKDDVVDLIFKRYGRHAAVVGGFSTFQGRSAFADIAKTLGVSEYQIRRMTERIPHTSAAGLEAALRESLECRDLPFAEEPFRTALQLAIQLDGMPRYAKMHPCGVVLSREPVMDLCPLFTGGKGWPVTHFDMDAVEAIGLVKMDILAQGGLAVMRDTMNLLRERGIEVDLKGLKPWRDPEVWAMIAAGATRGVHHIESPSMITLQRMAGVDNIDDLIAVVSVIRPGAAR